MKSKLTRREFLRVSAIASAGAVLAACAPAPTATPVPPTVAPTAPRAPTLAPTTAPTAPPAPTSIPKPTVPPSKYNEASALADLVKAGKLPPVDQRLPKKPYVVKGRAAIGKYGGEVRMMRSSVTNIGYDWVSERPLSYSDLDFKSIEGMVFESWEVKDDGKTFVFTLRDGLKWSDGNPFTTEDVRFWWEDVALNKDLSTSVDWQFRHGGEPMKMKVIDPLTFQVTFVRPFGNFIAHMTRFPLGRFILPSQYLKQFHSKYRPAAELDAEVKKAGFTKWPQLFNAKNLGMFRYGSPGSQEHPTLGAWIVSDITSAGTAVLDRNPYYWKVDEAGNQLPYFDRLRYELIQKSEMIPIKLIQGDLDFLGTGVATIASYPLYKEYEGKQPYVVGDYISTGPDRYTLFPNPTVKDQVLREIIQHPNFVKALSVAINREEINKSLYYGLAKMGQLAPMPGSRYYEEEFGKAWAQYDKALANKLLDEMGLDKRDAQKFRLRPDGQRLSLEIQHSGIRVGPSLGQFTEMVISYWRDIGIDASTREIQAALEEERWQNDEIQVAAWYADRSTDLLLTVEMRWFVPTEPDKAGPGSAWGRWFSTGGLKGEKPPQRILDFYDLYAQIQETTDETKRTELVKTILRSHAKDPLGIGSVLECPGPLVFNKKMQNLPKAKSVVGWDTYNMSTYHPEAWFYSS